jgi:uncharacterized protein
MVARHASAALLAAALLPALEGAAAPPSGPSFDCATARELDERHVCDEPELAALDRRMGELYAAALKRASPADRERLREEQAELLRLRSACAGPRGAAPPARSAATTCMRLLYARRVSQLAAAAPSIPEAVRARSIKWADAKRHVEVDIAYPALVAGTPGAAAFDAFFEKQAKRWEARARSMAADGHAKGLTGLRGTPSTVEVSFEVALATERIVTVVSSGYEHRTGNARSLPFRAATTFDVVLGRPLGEGDLFAPGGMKGAIALALEKVRSGREIDEGRLVACRKAASDLSRWTFGGDAVEVTFPIDATAPSGSGETRIQLGYGELRPFMRVNAAVLPR